MNFCLFFEGTGQGVAGKITNVTRVELLPRIVHAEVAQAFTKQLRWYSRPFQSCGSRR